MNTSIIKEIAIYLVAVLAAVSSGCGSSQGPVADMDKAHAAVKQTLEAWKSGKPADNSPVNSTEIVFQDEDRQLGYRLINYKPGADVRLAGHSVYYPVVLEMKSPRGRIVKKQVIYSVSTSPILLVLRQDG